MRELSRLADRQRGLASTAQLEELGWGRSGVRRGSEAGRWLTVRRNVVRLPGAVVSWESDVLAAILAAGPGADAVASHLSAARLWGWVAPRSRWWRSDVEVTSSRQLRLEGVRAHVGLVGPLDRERRRCVPVTGAARTLLDLSASVPEAALGVFLDEALRQRALSLRELSWAVSRAGCGDRSPPGLHIVRSLLAERQQSAAPSANAWEAEMDRMWDRLGLPPAQRQYWVVTPHGSYRPDRALVDERIAVDWNGYDYHGRRSTFDYDSDRRGHMIEAGWLPLDFTSRSTVEHVCRTVLAAVGQRRAQRR